MSDRNIVVIIFILFLCGAMALLLTLAQKEFITEIDFQTHQILQQSGQEALLIFLAKKLPALKSIIDAATHDELDWYCAKFDGFRQVMTLLEQLAKGCAEGLFDDIL